MLPQGVRPLLFAWWRFTRGMTLGVRAAVFDEAGRILLVRHSYVPGWHFPGGGVDAGETAQDALARELGEETGIAPAGAPTLVGLYLNAHASTRDHVALYRVPDWTRVAEPVLGGEIVEVGFFAPDALPEGTTEGTRRRLAEMGGAPLSAVW